MLLLLFFEAIHQISRSQDLKNWRFESDVITRILGRPQLTNPSDLPCHFYTTLDMGFYGLLCSGTSYTRSDTYFFHMLVSAYVASFIRDSSFIWSMRLVCWIFVFFIVYSIQYGRRRHVFTRAGPGFEVRGGANGWNNLKTGGGGILFSYTVLSWCPIAK